MHGLGGLKSASGERARVRGLEVRHHVWIMRKRNDTWDRGSQDLLQRFNRDDGAARVAPAAPP
jgi:hypothetical protein